MNWLNLFEFNFLVIQWSAKQAMQYCCTLLHSPSVTLKLGHPSVLSSREVWSSTHWKGSVARFGKRINHFPRVWKSLLHCWSSAVRRPMCTHTIPIFNQSQFVLHLIYPYLSTDLAVHSIVSLSTSLKHRDPFTFPFTTLILSIAVPYPSCHHTLPTQSSHPLPTSCIFSPLPSPWYKP